MNILKHLTLLALLCLPLQALAITGIEFMQLPNVSKQRELLEVITMQYIQHSYKKVPDWPALLNKCNELIRKNGWAYRSIDEIAMDAAVELGMTH